MLETIILCSNPLHYVEWRRGDGRSWHRAGIVSHGASDKVQCKVIVLRSICYQMWNNTYESSLNNILVRKYQSTLGISLLGSRNLRKLPKSVAGESGWRRTCSLLWRSLENIWGAGRKMLYAGNASLCTSANKILETTLEYPAIWAEAVWQLCYDCFSIMAIRQLSNSLSSVSTWMGAPFMTDRGSSHSDGVLMQPISRYTNVHLVHYITLAV